MALFFSACSGGDLTGSAVKEISTLTVIVRNENGSLMYGASIYVNDEFKGKTNKYGELRGTKEIVLQPGDNYIHIDAAGYITLEPILVSGSGAGQRLTFILERPRTDYVLRVYDGGGEVSAARVTLSHQSKVQTAFTNGDGEVAFEQLADGEYVVTIQKGQHRKEEFAVNISWDEHGDTYRSAITLEQEAELAVYVTAEDGTILPEAQVSLYLKDNYNSPQAWPIAAKFTKDDGKVYFRNVDYGEVYVVEVRREGFEVEQETVKFRPGHDLLEIELEVDTD